jgi:hypothetical protein
MAPVLDAIRAAAAMSSAASAIARPRREQDAREIHQGIEADYWRQQRPGVPPM